LQAYHKIKYLWTISRHNILVLTYVFCLAANIRRINNIISYETRILQSDWLATRNYCHKMVGRENKCPLAPSPNHSQTVSHELIFRRGEVYSTQTILNFVSDLQKVICFLRVLCGPYPDIIYLFLLTFSALQPTLEE
jgi:hypothetical protein